MATPEKKSATTERATASAGLTNASWAQRAFVSELPSDFLRVNRASESSSAAPQSREEMDRMAAIALQQHYSRAWHHQRAPAHIGKLHVTVAQAKLTKNYGLTRMDPYVRMRIGHYVYETPTSYNGATNPHWNKTVMCYLAEGVTTMHVEIYDECSFTDDSQVAFATIEIPEGVLKRGQTLDDWFPLSGKQGTDKEGMINLVMNFIAASSDPMLATPVPLMVPGARGYYTSVAPPVAVPVYTMPPQSQSSQIVAISATDIQQMKEMFPTMDEEIIRSVLQSRQNNKDEAVAALLELSS